MTDPPLFGALVIATQFTWIYDYDVADPLVTGDISYGSTWIAYPD